MVQRWSRDDFWLAMQTERAALADDLAELDEDTLRQPSHCGRWTVEDVLAHVTVRRPSADFAGLQGWL